MSNTEPAASGWGQVKVKNEHRLIDANALLKKHCDGCSLAQQKMCENDPVCGSAMWIVEAPTVDAVEVVRCKDCQYWTEEDGFGMFCSHWGGMLTDTNPDDFCSYGERREG